MGSERKHYRIFLLWLDTTAKKLEFGFHPQGFFTSSVASDFEQKVDQLKATKIVLKDLGRKITNDYPLFNHTHKV